MCWGNTDAGGVRASPAALARFLRAPYCAHGEASAASMAWFVVDADARGARAPGAHGRSAVEQP
jgi:trimethylamine:corrinoid methyltransferase-like protein